MLEANAPAVTATIAAHDPWPTKADPAAAMPVSNGPEMAKILLTFNAKLPSLINIPVAAENKRVEDIFKAKRGAPTVPADATPAIVAAVRVIMVRIQRLMMKMEGGNGRGTTLAAESRMDLFTTT
ncbi:hypothetical protein NC653_010202 [Populus alba x Populus x berolinensis]|uniref:Uncharacterized protein n=1 Tax=Populus alba x Populus x berolinensis TaxID=444605 RepID=A0AAD6R0Q9_9ROSI|nr:hypothetical protein NC653_010202 [Populus alba x Populus x berolinensis]